MFVKIAVIFCVFGVVLGAPSPKLRLRPRQEASDPTTAAMMSLQLPSNATALRPELTDTFSCRNRTYGYYADMDNGCQVFHVCLPVQFADGRERVFRWSFICPEETQFNQENFTCMRAEDAIDCEESEKYYELNDTFGQVQSDEPVPESRQGGANATTQPGARSQQGQQHRTRVSSNKG